MGLGSLPAGRRGPGEGEGASQLRARPACTHQHYGKALLQFTWLRHRQLQRHGVRPEVGLLRIHAPCVAHAGCALEPGATPAPLSASEITAAPGARLPPSAAPRRVCSARRSLALAPGAEPPPGLPHALGRPSAAPASSPREGSAGRRAPLCMVLPAHRPLSAGASSRRVVPPPPDLPPLTLADRAYTATHARPAPPADKCGLALADTMPRSPTPPPGQQAPPTRPAGCRDT